MLVLNTSISSLLKRKSGVSILVLVDVGLKPTSLPLKKQLAIQFQSLFWWMLVLNGEKIKEYLASVDCFNPCFGGCWS